MPLYLETIDSYVACNYKAYLKIKKVSGSKSDFEVFYNEQKANFLKSVINDITIKKCNFLALEGVITTTILKHGYDYLINGQLIYDNIYIDCELIEKVPQKSKLGDFSYVPNLIIPTEKTPKNDKIKLSIIALALSEVQGTQVNSGRVYHPNGSKSINLSSIRKATKTLADIHRFAENQDEPILVLNKHCKVCEFHSYCLSKAKETDNLSLLSGITVKEIKKKNSKGIFTVNQLSYTFKPRRKRKKTTKYRKRFLSELKALSIREDRIYVYELPELPESQIEIYCDFEGITDETYCYLIGVVIKENDTLNKHYFWADNADEELSIFRQFISLIAKYEKYTLYHYGSYEITHLKRISNKLSAKEKRKVKQIITSSCNLLSFFYSHIYVPTYSNELKEIGKYLGFKWTNEKASGIQSIVWRKKWEITKEEIYKNTLIQYNTEDCEVLLKVKSLINSIIRNQDNPLPEDRVASTVYYKDLKKQSIFSFQVKNFAFDEIDFINKCSFFDYQRERVYARTNPVIRKAQLKLKKKKKNNLKPNQEINIIARVCLFCKVKELKRGSSVSKKVIDLKFFASGVKKWIIKYQTNKYYCQNCKKAFLPQNYLKISSKFGHNLICWTIYHHIVNKESFRQIAANMEELFSLYIAKTNLHYFKTYFMKYYEITYKRLVNKILNSGVLYIDETPLIMTTETGYGWVMTNVEEVASFYKPTREGDFLGEFFKGFKGILVTDFYAAYDTIDCLQQKCLIHLIRDLNDDLLKNPFDNEFKQLTQDFTFLLQSIVRTIDKYGLKKRNLFKHKKDADNFLKKVENIKYTSDICLQYQKRIVKNKDKLFLFLLHNNVSWNNNNAEHAIKLLATHSNKNLATFKSTRMDEYLRIMSIYQTCKYKGISFLKFMLSKEKDIDVFCHNSFRI